MSGDNLVAWLDKPECQTDEAVRILAFPHTMATEHFDPAYVNIYYFPHLFWRCTAYNRAGSTFKVWGGKDCFIPQIKRGECWIARKNIIEMPKGWQPDIPINPMISWMP
jgi:hypothetical protein